MNTYILVPVMKALLLALLLGLPGAAAAGTTTSFGVRLTIVSSCTVRSAQPGVVHTQCAYRTTPKPIVKAPRPPLRIERERDGLAENVRVVEVVF